MKSEGCGVGGRGGERGCDGAGERAEAKALVEFVWGGGFFRVDVGGGGGD